MRILSSLPALLLLAMVSLVAAVVWIVGALAVLATGRMPAFAHDFIAMKLRYQLRLLAYHLAIVEAYPSLADTPLPQARLPGVA